MIGDFTAGTASKLVISQIPGLRNSGEARMSSGKDEKRTLLKKFEATLAFPTKSESAVFNQEFAAPKSAPISETAEDHPPVNITTER